MNPIKQVFAMLMIAGAPAIVTAQIYTPSGIIQGSSGSTTKVGVGTTAPATLVHIKTNVLNDGLRIEQGGTNNNSGAAQLGLYNTLTGGHSWALLSTSTSNSQGGGRLLFYDYSVPAGQANQATRMCIDDNGNVGIGTFHHQMTPSVKLHVNDGSLKFTGTDPVYGAPNIFWGGQPFSYLGAVTAQYGEWALEYNNSMQGLNFWRPDQSHLGPVGSGAQQATVNGVLFLSNDNLVGISTTTPTAKLEINAIGGYKPLNILSDRPDWSYGIHYQHQGSSYGHKAIAVSHNGAEVFTVNTNGLVSIGNNSFNVPGLGLAAPPYSLVVGRGILTERVKVAVSSDLTNWSDFVFEPDYALATMDSVEAFVKQHKHLPNVPSAGEVYGNGLDVAQMDATLLRQIEELWLHMLELKKDNERLQVEISALKKQ